MRALDAAMSAPWAMLPEHVEALMAIAAREANATPEALEAYRARHAERAERMRLRGGVAILDVYGPLFKRANLFVHFSGATSYEMLRRDLQVALDDQSVDAIMLNVDSPGGEVSGCDELATAIYQARGRKPITAFVSGMACSGAYWIASAADRIVVSSSSTLGSIGVVLGITDRKKADERAGISRIEFVSSQSPGKRPDVETDEGKRRLQKLVDDLGDVFVTDVARHRGVAKSTVISKFGNGGVEIGANAVRLGMADAVGQFEEVVSSLTSRRRKEAGPPLLHQISGRGVSGLGVSAVTAGAAVVAKHLPRAGKPSDAVAAELDRFRQITALAKDCRTPALLAALRDQPDIPAAKIKILIEAAALGVASIGWNRETRYLVDKMLAGALGTEGLVISADGTIEKSTRAAGSKDWSDAVASANGRRPPAE